MSWRAVEVERLIGEDHEFSSRARKRFFCSFFEKWERRIYFDFDAGGRPWVYCGDEKLSAPEYDYAKLFQKDARVEPIALDPEVNNAAYVPRPDDRPWSDQHPALLWVAILAAVVILGAVAMHSLKTSAKPVS